MGLLAPGPGMTVCPLAHAWPGGGVTGSGASLDAEPCPLRVARDTGCEVAYLPGLSIRRAADPYPR